MTDKINRLKEVKKYANRIGYTDVNPCEVVKVISDKCVEIREMIAEEKEWKKEWVAGGFSGVLVNQNEQKWEIKSAPHWETFRIRFSNPKNGYPKWQDSYGRTYRMNDVPVKFYDYNF